MKVLLASSPATGHFNPLLVVARILKKAGHEPVLYTSKLFRGKTEAAGVPFFPLPEEADQAVLDKIADFLKRNRYAPGPRRGCRFLDRSSSIPCPSSFAGCSMYSGSFRLILYCMKQASAVFFRFC